VATPENKIHIEQPRSSFGAWIGILLLFCVFGLFVWAVMGAMPRTDTYERKRAEARAEKLKKAREESKTAVESYGWVDKDKGVVRVPVKRAMELAVAELAQKKPAPAGPAGPEGDKAGMQVTAPMTPAPGAAPQTAAPPTSSPKAVAHEGPGSQSDGQPAAAANPAGAPAGSQPGPSTSPPPPPSSGAREFQRGGGEPTPVQSPPGPALPVPGTTPGASATATPGEKP
jgi:hypothetical protein